MTQLITVDRATLEQMMVALEDSIDCVRHKYETDWRHGLPTRKAQLDGMKESLDQHEAAITALRAAIANAEPKKFSVTNTATSTVPRTIESFFEAMDKEVAAGRLVRTGPMEWTKL